VQELKAEEIGKVSMHLGAGRIKKEDLIQPEVGLVLEKKIGDIVKVGDVLARIHAKDQMSAEKAKQELEQIYKIVSEKQEKRTPILGIIEN